MCGERPDLKYDTVRAHSREYSGISAVFVYRSFSPLFYPRLLELLQLHRRWIESAPPQGIFSKQMGLKCFGGHGFASSEDSRPFKISAPPPSAPTEFAARQLLLGRSTVRVGLLRLLLLLLQFLPLLLQLSFQLAQFLSGRSRGRVGRLQLSLLLLQFLPFSLS